MKNLFLIECDNIVPLFQHDKKYNVVPSEMSKRSVPISVQFSEFSQFNQLCCQKCLFLVIFARNVIFD